MKGTRYSGHFIYMKKLAATLLFALPAFAQTAAKGVNLYSIESDIAIGREEALRLTSALPVVHDPKLDEYCSRLMGELARHADSRFAYSFVVYEDRRPSAPVWVAMQMPLDAFSARPREPVALAGGPIFIPISLIASAPDEATLAFHLAHAVAHVSLRHSTRLATREELMDLAAVPLTQVQSASGAVVQVSTQVARQTAVLSMARQFERAADTLATGIMAEAGYDPAKALASLEGQGTPEARRRMETVLAKRDSLPEAVYGADTGAFEEIKALAAGIRLFSIGVFSRWSITTTSPEPFLLVSFSPS